MVDSLASTMSVWNDCRGSGSTTTPSAMTSPWWCPAATITTGSVSLTASGYCRTYPGIRANSPPAQANGDRVDLVSEFTNGDGHLQERRAKHFMVVAYSTLRGNAAYYPETNPLVPLDHTAAKSNTPVSKAIVVRLEPAWDV
jgi:hypothetical protein